MIKKKYGCFKRIFKKIALLKRKQGYMTEAVSSQSGKISFDTASCIRVINITCPIFIYPYNFTFSSDRLF